MMPFLSILFSFSQCVEYLTLVDGLIYKIAQNNENDRRVALCYNDIR